MIYSDVENKRWWDGLGKTGQRELFERIIERATSPSYVNDMVDKYNHWMLKGSAPSALSLISMRKWAK